MPGRRGMSDHDDRLLEALQAGFLGLDLQPEPDGFLDVVQGLLARGALRVAAGEIGTAHRPALVGLEECHPVVHGRNSRQNAAEVKFGYSHELLAAFESRHVLGVEFKPLIMHALILKAIFPICFDSAGIICAD